MSIKESVKINADLLIKEYQLSAGNAFDTALKMEELTILQTKIGNPASVIGAQRMYGIKENPQGRPISPCGPKGCGTRVVQKSIVDGEKYSTEGCLE